MALGSNLGFLLLASCVTLGKLTCLTLDFFIKLEHSTNFIELLGRLNDTAPPVAILNLDICTQNMCLTFNILEDLVAYR